MPHSQGKLVNKAFTPIQKEQVIRKLTDALVGENTRPLTWAKIEELLNDGWNIGG